MIKRIIKIWRFNPWIIIAHQSCMVYHILGLAVLFISYQALKWEVRNQPIFLGNIIYNFLQRLKNFKTSVQTWLSWWTWNWRILWLIQSISKPEKVIYKVCSVLIRTVYIFFSWFCDKIGWELFWISQFTWYFEDLVLELMVFDIKPKCVTLKASSGNKL